MQKLRLGSLFDGIGGFPLAAAVCGIEPVWASEIEPFPIEVTRLRFPGMLHVGDITKLRGAELPPVDIVCGGSPCQDLSIAGLRAGLAGARSGLFMEQLRVIREMRDADRARGRTALAVRPRYMLWENVPGAFSSYDGEDFRAVLEETARVAEPDVSIPRPEAGTWKSAGRVLGGNFSIAWAVYDAEFFGVAQRRRRIFLVADLAGHSAAEILFEREGLPGYIAAKRRTWEDIAAAAGIRRADAGGAEGGAGTRALTAYAANGRDEVRPMYGTAATITAHPSLRQETILLEREVCLNDQGGMRMGVSEGVSGTLRADMGGHPPIVLGSEQGGAEVAFDLCPTLTASAGMSGNNRPVLFENHSQDGRYRGPLEVAPTLQASCGMGGNNQPFCVEAPAYGISGTVIGRGPENGGNGAGVSLEVGYTLTARDRHGVCVPYQRVVGTLCSGDEKGVGNQYVSDAKCIIGPQNRVRRLTPLECERLQGFPDGWTDIPGASDTARYKALGNSVAVPCVETVLAAVQNYLRWEEKD